MKEYMLAMVLMTLLAVVGVNDRVGNDEFILQVHEVRENAVHLNTDGVVEIDNIHYTKFLQPGTAVYFEGDELMVDGLSVKELVDSVADVPLKYQ